MIDLLANGDRLTQKEFHRRYEACPEYVRAELLRGVVYMSSPITVPHSDYHGEASFALGLYRRATLGVQVLQRATIILGEECEPQPDLGLRIRPEYGGQSRTQGGFVAGPPELLAEIAFSSRAIDLHQKRLDYRQAGVTEYLVVSIEEPALYWFDFARHNEIASNRQGVYCSRVFPGLWIDGTALLALDSKRVERTLRRGLASREHAAFKKRLRDAHRRHQK